MTSLGPKVTSLGLQVTIESQSDFIRPLEDLIWPQSNPIELPMDLIGSLNYLILPLNDSKVTLSVLLVTSLAPK